MNRRQFFAGATAAGVCLGCGRRRAWAQGARVGQRREVTVGGKRVRTVDVHCHCTIQEVVDVVAGTPFEARARQSSRVPGNNPTMETRLATMDADGIDVEALASTNGGTAPIATWRGVSSMCRTKS